MRKLFLYISILCCNFLFGSFCFLSEKNHHNNRRLFMDLNEKCMPIFNCVEMQNDLEFIRILEGGYVKNITIVKWRNVLLVHSMPRLTKFEYDFESGMKMINKLHPSSFIAEIAGICYSPKQILTKYYKRGSADKISNIFNMENLTEANEFKIRLQLITDYLQIINFLHNSPVGCRVMCDSNDLKKTLSQYLVTDDFHLVLADLDALPRVDKKNAKLIKCGHRQLFGSFVAPEQLWPFVNSEFSDETMPGYDEKTDIWKIPDVVYYLLGESFAAEQLKFRLFDVLKLCKSHTPFERPSAQEIIDVFKKQNEYILGHFYKHWNNEIE